MNDLFTGLIQDLGRIEAIQTQGMSKNFRIGTRLVSSLALGDSLAVNGACLTITALSESSAEVTAIAETLSRTTLGKLTVGSIANLEPALRVGDRMGGHFVQGHVDGVGRINALKPLGVSTEILISAPEGIRKYIVEKGSIAIDGISLTVARCDEIGFWVAVIPHTWSFTTLKERKIGDELNLETDLIAKYIHQLMQHSNPQEEEPHKSGISQDRLRELGFI